MTLCRWCLRSEVTVDEFCSEEHARRWAEPAALPAEAEAVEILAAQLTPDPLIAGALEVSAEAWGRLRKDPALRDALARGRAREHQRLLAAMFEEAVNGNVAAAQFLLRARHGYEDKAGDVAPRVNVQLISLPQALTAEQWTKLRLVGSGGAPAPKLIDVTPGGAA